jgi:hypothetical protein
MIVLIMALPGDYLVGQGAFPGYYVTLLSDDEHVIALLAAIF